MILPKIHPIFALLLLVMISLVAGCRLSEREPDRLISELLSSPDSLEPILAQHHISKFYHDSVLTTLVLDQQIGFFREIGDGYSTRKSFIQNSFNPEEEDFEIIVTSEDGSRWLEFRFQWYQDQYHLVDIEPRLAHMIGASPE